MADQTPETPPEHASLGPVGRSVAAKLTAAFAPATLEIVDDSDSHRGHAGHDGAGESHFQVRIVAEAFRGMSRVERQRAVYAVLSDELAGRIHALSLTVEAP